MRKKSDINRRKKVNTAHAKKCKTTRRNLGSLAFLHKVTKDDLTERCFPNGIDKEKESHYTVRMSDLKDSTTLSEVIRPMLDVPYISSLDSQTTFSKDTLDFIEKIRKKKLTKLHATSTC